MVFSISGKPHEHKNDVIRWKIYGQLAVSLNNAIEIAKHVDLKICFFCIVN
jgi:hypothetical protein